MYWKSAAFTVPQATYKKYLLRWKTEKGSNGLGARVRLDYAAGGQWILGETEPQFSTSWKLETGDIEAGKTITNVRFYADDYPDNCPNGTYRVYYDFLLLAATPFEFPDAEVLMPKLENLYADLHPPGRGGDISQYQGSQSPIITIRGNMDLADWGTPKGQYLMKAWDMRTAPFQWFSSNEIKCKVTPRVFTPNYTTPKPTFTADMKFKSLSNLNALHSGGTLDGTLIWPELSAFGI